MPESFAPVERSDQIRASIEFEYSIDSLEIVWDIVRELLDRVIVDLTRRGCGARQIVLRFHHYHGDPIEQVVRLARPSRDPKNLFNLTRCALESIQTHEGFVRIDLDVPLYEKVTQQQITLHDQELTDAWLEWSSLVERLQIRLGIDAVLRPRWSESHLPENACTFQPATADAPKHEALAVHDVKPLSARPLCLLRRPIEVGVIVSPSDDREGAPISFSCNGDSHRVALCVGPERITGPWWEGNDKTRDYFVVENAQGERFWLFRVIETWKWYLHGKFE
jgi:protein ImuB